MAGRHAAGMRICGAVMISRVHIENFKSLVNFDLPPKEHQLGGFTCLIGLNGAGKSTLLQAFDFIAHVATGEVQNWLKNREWKKAELVSQLGKRNPVITFTVEMQSASGQMLDWHARFNTQFLKCTAETVRYNREPILKLEDGRLFLATQETAQRFDKVPFEFQGSVFSTLKLDSAHPGIAELKKQLQSLRSLELLSPQLMRKKARSAQDIGPSGEKLSPFLDQLSGEAKTKLLGMLQDFYPQLKSWNVRGFRAGWKILRIHEQFPDSGFFEAGHINDGFLRVIAILAQAFTEDSFLLLDEIENGISPAVVERLMDFLVSLGKQGKQVVVTTHSPVILNFLDDKVAREGVILLYKTRGGCTRSVYYFDQPETRDKLRALGPGEVFVDTDLRKMIQRLVTDPTNNAFEATTGP